jgi:uncharacterized membrane protein
MPTTPIDLNRYRKTNWKQRLLAVLGYVVVTIFCFPPLRGDFLLQIGLFLALWAICFNPKAKTPTFVRFHLIQGFAYTIALMFVPSISNVLLGLIDAILAFIPALSMGSFSQIAMVFLVKATFLLLLLLLLFNIVMVLLGKRHELPIVGKIATRLTY